MASGGDTSSNSGKRDERISAVVELYLQRRRQNSDQQQAIEKELVDGHPELNPELALQIRIAEAVFLATKLDPRKPTSPATKNSVPGPADELPNDQLIRIRCEHCGNKLNIVAHGRTEVSCPACGSSIPVEPDLTRTDPYMREPRFIGRFRIVSALGKGAFGTAYRAFDSELSRTVAIKVPLSGTFQSEQERQRFLREARSAARLQHANIVQLYEVNLDGEIPYIVTELIDGVSLADLISSRQLSCTESAKTMVDVSRAVDYAHRQGILHRDIKPGNILLDKDHRPYIADFGLARDTAGEITMTIDGEVLGTPAYMSPEQAKGEHAKMDFRSDVYSLGVVMYRLICGELPFRGSQRMLLHQVMHDDPRPPRRVNDHIPRDLETIVLKAMAKDRDKRYASAGEFADDLRRWLNNESIIARPAGPVTRLLNWRRRHPAVAGLTLGLIGLLIVIAVLSSVLAIYENVFREIAERSQKQAEANQRESTIKLAASHRQNGIRATENGDASRALVWFASALAVDPENEEIQRLRIGLTKQSLPDLRQLWTIAGQVTDLDVSSDGKRVLVVGNRETHVADGQGIVSVFDAESPNALPLYKLTSASYIREATFSGDRERIISVGVGPAAELWDAASGQRIAKLEHASQVRAAQFSPDSKSVVTVGHDGFARVWKSDDGSLLRELKHDSEEIDLIRFSPDGTHILTASRKEVGAPSDLTVWHLPDGVVELEPRAHSSYAYSTEFNHDGSRFLAAGEDGKINVWDSKSGELIATMPDNDSIHSARFLAESNKILSVLSRGDISIWGTDGRREASIRHPVASVDSSLDPSARIVAFAGIDGAVVPYLLDPLQAICGPLLNGESVSAIRFAPDGRHLVAGGKNGVVRLWDLAGLAAGKKILAHAGPVTHASFSPDGTVALTCSTDGTARLWNVATGLPVGEPMIHQGEIFDGAFSRDGKRVATASADKTARLWNAASGAPLGPGLPHTEQVNRLAFSPKEDLLITATIDGLVSGWRFDKPKPEYTLKHLALVWHIQFSPDGESFVTVSLDKTARLWRALDGASIREPMQHDQSAIECAFTLAGDRIATCALDNKVKIWATRGDISPIEELAFLTRPTSVHFDRSGRRLLTGDRAGNTILWEQHNGRFVQRTRFHEPKYQLKHADFHPLHDDGIVLANGSIDAAQQSARLGDGAVFLYDLTTESPLSSALLFRGGVFRAFFDSTGKRIIAPSHDGSAKIWDLTGEERPVAEITELAELLSGWSLGVHSKLETVIAPDLRRKFEQIGRNVTPVQREDVRQAAWNTWIQSLAHRPIGSDQDNR